MKWFKLAADDRKGRERVHGLFKSTFPRFKEFEPQLRAAAQLALEQWALQRAGLLEEEPYRRGHRIGILEHALAPLKADLTPAARERLHRALSVIYGIESYAILKDMWGLGDRDLEKTVVWMADARIDASMRDGAAAAPAKAPAGKRRGSGAGGQAGRGGPEQGGQGPDGDQRQPVPRAKPR